MKKRFINALVIFASLAFLYLLWRSRTQVEGIVSAAQGAEVRWLLVAVLAQFAGYFFQTRAHQQALWAAGVSRKLREVLPLVLAALVINTAAPTGGASGALLFAEDAEKRGESQLGAAGGLILLLLASYFGLLVILTFSFVYLRATGHLGPVEVTCYLILLATAITYAALLVLSRSKSEVPRRTLTWINDTLFKVRHLFSKKARTWDTWVDNTARELKSASGCMYQNPWRIADLLFMELLINVFNLLTLFLIFLAFGQITKAGLLVAGYAIGELFKIVSPAPEGVGVTEVSMALVYSSFGMDPLTATAVSLIYRGLNFWIPLGLGFLVLQTRHLRWQDFRKGPDFTEAEKPPAEV